MKNGGLRARLRREHLVVAYVVLAVAGLIAVRATVGALDFISVGWILVLAALPLLPWIVPQLGEFLKTISPYVQSLKLGGLQLDLREISRPVMIPSTGILANVPNDVGALSTSTGITELLAALREFRNKGAGPVVVIDLRDGHKWRLPNLYFLVRLLEIEPVVSELVFTEIRGGTDGHVVGTCSPGDFRRQVEAVVPGYAAAASTIQTPVQPDLHDMNQAQQLGASFSVLEQALGPSPSRDDDPALGYVTSERIRRDIVGRLLSPTSVEVVAGVLPDEDVRAIIEFPYRYVPATTSSFLSGLVDRDIVALAVARAAVARA